MKFGIIEVHKYSCIKTIFLNGEKGYKDFKKLF